MRAYLVAMSRWGCRLNYFTRRVIGSLFDCYLAFTMVQKVEILRKLAMCPPGLAAFTTNCYGGEAIDIVFKL